MGEAQIKQEVNGLSPGQFQRLAESFAQLTWPERYSYLIPKGRNAENATTKGWPDAWAPDELGRVNAVEATRQLNWERHLAEDLRKVERLPQGEQLSSFVFVTRGPRGTDEKVRRWRSAFEATGLQPEDINFVFIGELCRSLCEPRFARVRAELLGLPATALPFYPIENARALYGDGTATAFRPTKQEYLDGRVHQSRVALKLRPRLEAQGWALLRGKGASGKTILCTTIAHEFAADLRPAWYLDLISLDVAAINSAAEQMALLGGERVLFVIDNIHVAAEHAGAIFDNWEQRKDGSQLLLAGRSTSPDAVAGYGSSIFDLEADAVETDPGIFDLRGIFRRLAERESGAPTFAPNSACRRWLKLFGGDLVAFSSAVSSRGPSAVANDWQLRPTDAVDHVRHAYLDQLLPKARPTLLRLAVFSAYESPCPEEIASLAELRPLVESGLILTSGTTPATAQTIHPGVGRLILAAAGRSSTSPALLDEIAQRDPHAAARLARGAPADVAIPLWRSIFALSPAALIEAGFRSFPWAVRMMIRKGHFRPSELDARFAAEEQALSTAARAASLRDLGATLGIASSKLESTFAVLCSFLTENGKPANWLVDRVARTEDWSGLAYFAMQTGRLWESLAAGLDEEVCDGLGPRLADAYLSGSFSAPVSKALRALTDFWPECADAAEACLDGMAPDRWAEAAIDASVDDLYRASVFLHGRVAGQRLNEAVHDPAFVTHMLERHLSASPGGLAHARRTLTAISPEAASALKELLAAPDSGRRWAQAAFRRSLHLLPEALRSADLRELRAGVIAYLLEIDAGELSELLLNTSPTVVSEVARTGDRLGERLLGILRGEARGGFTKLLLDSSAQQAGRFLGRSAATEAIASGMDGNEWVESRPMLTLGRHPASFAPIANGLARGGRGDLAHATAMAFGEMMISGEVPIGQLHLGTLSHLLRLTRDEPIEWRERVVDAVWGERWLQDRFAGDRISELARALFSIWHYYPPLAKRVPLDLLTERTVEALRAARTVGWLYSALELIGAASLYGMPAAAIAGQRSVSRKTLDPMVAGLAGLSGPLTAQEAQLWLGFITLAEANIVELPLDNVDGILKRLSNQIVVTNRHAETVARIEAWLSQRVSAGSRAVGEES